MDAELIANINQFGSYFGWALRALGLLVFGLMSAWLTISVFKKAEKNWQVQAAAVAILLYLAGTMVTAPNPAAVGAYTLGAGAGLFIFGMSREKED